MTNDEIIDDLKERFSPFCDEAVECIKRLQRETKIADGLIQHLHSENKTLRKENEQMTIKISDLQKENKFIKQYLCTPKLGVVKNDRE